MARIIASYVCDCATNCACHPPGPQVAELPPEHQMELCMFVLRLSQHKSPTQRLAAVDAAYALLNGLEGAWDAPAGYKVSLTLFQGCGEVFYYQVEWGTECQALKKKKKIEIERVKGSAHPCVRNWHGSQLGHLGFLGPGHHV